MITTSPVLFVTVLGLTFFFFWFFIHTIFKNKALIGAGDMIFPGDQLKIPTVGGKYQASVFENFFSPSLYSSPLLVIERSKTTSLSLSCLFSSCGCGFRFRHQRRSCQDHGRAVDRCCCFRHLANHKGTNGREIVGAIVRRWSYRCLLFKQYI